MPETHQQTSALESGDIFWSSPSPAHNSGPLLKSSDVFASNKGKGRRVTTLSCLLHLCLGVVVVQDAILNERVRRLGERRLSGLDRILDCVPPLVRDSSNPGSLLTSHQASAHSISARSLGVNSSCVHCRRRGGGVASRGVSGVQVWAPRAGTVCHKQRREGGHPPQLPTHRAPQSQHLLAGSTNKTVAGLGDGECLPSHQSDPRKVPQQLLQLFSAESSFFQRVQQSEPKLPHLLLLHLDKATISVDLEAHEDLFLTVLVGLLVLALQAVPLELFSNS